MPVSAGEGALVRVRLRSDFLREGCSHFGDKVVRDVVSQHTVYDFDAAVFQGANAHLNIENVFRNVPEGMIRVETRGQTKVSVIAQVGWNMFQRAAVILHGGKAEFAIDQIAWGKPERLAELAVTSPRPEGRGFFAFRSLTIV